MARRWKLGIPAIVGVVVIAGALLTVAPSLYEVEDKGRNLLPYDAGLIYKVRVADATLYADSETRPEADMVTGVALAALATMALMTYFLLSSAGRGPRLLRFYGLAAAGLAFLAADELLALHETVGHNLRFLRDLVPGAGRPDDVIVMLYAIPAFAFLVRFRDILLKTKRVRWLVGAALGLFLVAAVGDAVSAVVEEPVELVGSACLVAALILLVSAHLSETFGLPRTLPFAEQMHHRSARRFARTAPAKRQAEPPVPAGSRGRAPAAPEPSPRA